MFVLRNNVSAAVATAHGSLLGLSFLVFIDPRAGRAFGAEEVLAGVTEVTDVNEIENDMATGSSLALNSAQGLL